LRTSKEPHQANQNKLRKTRMCAVLIWRNSATFVGNQTMGENCEIRYFIIIFCIDFDVFYICSPLSL